MQQSDLNGILLMNKPQGFTSHDVVAKLRGILHTRRIGHGGTLDPMATGVLPVFVGGATKAADFAAAQDKEYVAGFTLGYCTDTQDVTGEMLQTSERYAAEYAVKQMVRRFIGPQQQVPPMYSAVKVGGQPLYKLAREGKTVERKARPRPQGQGSGASGTRYHCARNGAAGLRRECPEGHAAVQGQQGHLCPHTGQ